MTQRPKPWLIGLFLIAGLFLIFVAVIAAGGTSLFSRKENAVMHFNGSIYGLQVGAPVVFRGVQLGTVSSIGLVYDPKDSSFSIPVTAELSPEVIQSVSGNGEARTDLAALVARGLRARLAMQSLLTGLLYVDLDLDTRTAARTTPPGPPTRAFVEVPTAPTAIQALKGQLEGMDIRGLLDDISAIASSARSLAAGPELKQALSDLAQMTGSLKRMTAELERQAGPVAQSARQAMQGGATAMNQLGTAASQVSQTAARWSRTAEQLNALTAQDAPLVQRLQDTADELARTAASLRQQTGDTGVVRHLDDTLRDIGAAARAVRELADLLDRQPAALLRGRSPEEVNTAPNGGAATKPPSSAASGAGPR